MNTWMKKLLCSLLGVMVLLGALCVSTPAYAAGGAAKGPAEGVRDIAVFLPYYGAERDFFVNESHLGKLLSDYTGGELKIYKGTDATIDALASAVESCAVVIIGSHGLNGSIGLRTDKGLTNADKNGHASNWGKDGGSDCSDTFWGVDGTAITNHMTKDAPNNLVLLCACQGLKSSRMCAPLLDRGVSVVMGFSESASCFGNNALNTAFIESLCEGNTVAEAFSAMQQEIGRWDSVFVNYTLQMAKDSKVAFPFIASEEDPYPGVGHVNQVQTVKSGWRLPLNTYSMQRLILSLGSGIGQKAVAINCKQAQIISGALPQGVSYSVSDDGVLYLTGKPTQTGYTVTSFRIVTKSNNTLIRNMALMVVDESNVIELPLKEVTYTAQDRGESGTSYRFKKTSDYYEIPLEFTDETVSNFAMRVHEGALPHTLYYDMGLARNNWHIRSTPINAREMDAGYYYATPPGRYDVTLDLITYPDGKIYRRPVAIIVKPAYSLQEENSFTAVQGEPLPTSEYSANRIGIFTYEYGWRYWRETEIQSVMIVSGSLPKGVFFACSLDKDKPFGIYGTPAEAGDFKVQIRYTTFNNAYYHTINLHVEPRPPITGTVKLTYPGDHPFAGEEIQAVLTDVPTPNKIQWERSSDGVEYTDIAATGATFKSNPNFTGKSYIRAKVTATGYVGALYSDVTYLTEALDLTGGIAYLSSVAVGQKLTTQLYGTLGSLYYDTAPEIVHLQWQRSANGGDGWTDIAGATEKNYTPAEADAGQFIRLKATADRYKGEVYGGAKQVGKLAWSPDAPVKPALSLNSGYAAVTVNNAKANQEYTVSYVFNTIDWSAAMHPDADGTLELPADSDRTVYVYTRLRETGPYEAGKKTEYSKIYNGYVTSLADLTLDHSNEKIKIGDVIALTVSPLPEDFSGWNDSYTVTWYVNGSGVELFANEACYIPVTQHMPSTHKTVYVKGLSQSQYVEVAVEKQVGMSDVRRASCFFEVADAEGNFVLDCLRLDDVVMKAGETALSAWTTQPSPAKVGALSFVKTQGESDLTLTDNGDGTISITAPADAKLGTYYYEIKVNGLSTPITSTIKITVIADQVTVTLDAANGLGQTVKQTVPYGYGFVLPELPESFTPPTDFVFDGWDKGNVGTIVIIGEDTVFKAKWAAHVHTLTEVPAVAPGCVTPGNTAHWVCEECGKEFSDAGGTMEAPTIDYFMVPATGHKPASEPVKTLEKEPTCTEDGGYDLVVACTVCGTELSSTHTVVPKLGHTISLVAEKAPTCTGIGAKGHYECSVCGWWFEDAAGTTEVTDFSTLILPALDHDWGEWTVTKPATLEEEGEETRTCNRCGLEEKRSIAKLDVISYTITVTAEANGSASASAGTAEEGAEVLLTVTPNDGYQFKEWQVISGGITITDNKFTVGTENVEIKAVFEETPAETVYAFTKGNGAAWTKGSGAMLDFTVKGSPDDTNTFTDFTGIAVDGTAVSKSSYTAASGSVEIRLKAEYLEGLATGTHTIKANFTGGSAEAAFTIIAAVTPAGSTDFDDVAVPSATFSFRKVWEGGSEKSIDFTLYKQGGTVYHHGFNKEIVSKTEWQYNAWFSAPAACYVIEEPVKGYKTRYENVGIYTGITDRCCDGGTIINYKVPKTGDDANLTLWLVCVLAGLAIVSVAIHAGKRKKAHSK